MEVVAAMVVLAIIAAPVGGALAVSWRVNAYADRVMQARLDVSTAAETLMAKGIDSTVNYPSLFDKVNIGFEPDSSDDPNAKLFNVTISSKSVPSVSVETKIRAAGVGDGEGSGT